MATAEQLKMLIKSHFEQNDERFRTIVLQLAAHEANQGHSALARDIRDLIDKSRNGKVVPLNKELNELLYNATSDYRLSNLVVSEELRTRIERILQEFKQRERLHKHGLGNRRKILLAGPPGTGKTMTATVLAGELQLPFCTILVDKLVTKYMGETSAKLRQIFDAIREFPGVYLFDEFDAIGSERTLDNDVGEMRRVLNTFLQFIEQDRSDSLIVAATNSIKLLDQALFRRFDDVLYYDYPTQNEIVQLIENRLSGFGDFSTVDVLEIAKFSKTLSHADITKACDDAIKEAILSDQTTVTLDLLRKMITERHSVYDWGEK
ncbi:atpase aaa-type core [Lucifera butyrica]|uniref:Atpase aaa-type core n=1 Tax=Lucifera butyrica TaxID=1351585 RepID=A0A498R725_9FIRM|nr:ATP-binding protein [Lucifera butyrica]VBB07161.1 atpase aaa-type core [Lucifera butyrica]